MEKPTVEVDSLTVKVVITYNPVTAEYNIEGVDESPVTAWGMLEYTLSRLRRAMAQHDLREQLEKSPLVVPGSMRTQ